MAAMEQGDMKHLASLARIAVSDEEATALSQDIDAVLNYVSAVSDITATADEVKKVGAVHNVFRADEVTNEPDTYTETLLTEAPSREDRWLKVKKILNQDES